MRSGPVALECLRLERVVLVSSGEMGGGERISSTFNLRISFFVSLFWVWVVLSLSSVLCIFTALLLHESGVEWCERNVFFYSSP